MSRKKAWTAIWRVGAGTTVGSLLTAGALASLEIGAASIFMALGLLLAWLSLVALQKLTVNNVRTIVRQELRGINIVPQPHSTKGIDEAARRLEKAVRKMSQEQSPLARELHIKTVEEIRFLQAQISALEIPSRH